MSLAIDCGEVRGLLIAGVWYEIESLEFDSYEFMDGDLLVHGGGDSGVCAKGFEAVLKGKANGKTRIMMGPITSIQAVRR